MKLRTITLSLVLALLASLTCPAWADVIWEPMDDTFYQMHQQTCQVIDRVYVVPEDSSLNLYRSPEDGTILTQLSGGDRVYVSQSLETDGDLWAVGYPIGDNSMEGWFRLGRLQLEYDTQQFYEEFQQDFTDYDGQLDNYQIQEQIYTWTYPGSGVSDRTLTEADRLDRPITCQYIYTDPDGGQWGYVGYFMGRCGWIYLDDPESANPPTFLQQPENTVTETGPETAPGPLWTQGSFWAAGLVVIVVAVTALLLLRARKQSKK